MRPGTRATVAIAGALAAAHGAPALAPHVSPLAAALGLGRRLDLPGAVALTFDDGPHPRGTPAVLEVLRAHGAVATFFVVGEQLRRTGSLSGEGRAAGHALALHGDGHRTLVRLSAREVRRDLDRLPDTPGPAPPPGPRAPHRRSTPPG